MTAANMNEATVSRIHVHSSDLQNQIADYLALILLRYITGAVQRRDFRDQRCLYYYRSLIRVSLYSPPFVLCRASVHPN